MMGTMIMILPRWIRRRRLRPLVEDAYMALRNACEPKTLDPKDPGNAEFIKSDARDLVNSMTGRLRRAGIQPPDLCDRSDESLAEWFRFLGKLRSDLS